MRQYKQSLAELDSVKKEYLIVSCKTTKLHIEYMNMGSYNCCLPNRSEFKKIVSLSSLLKIIGEESRLKLLCILKKGEHCVCELIEHVEMSQSLISHHLKDLKDAGVVTDEKRGLRVYYSLTKKGKHITNLLFTIPKKAAYIKCSGEPKEVSNL